MNIDVRNITSADTVDSCATMFMSSMFMFMR